MYHPVNLFSPAETSTWTCNGGWKINTLPSQDKGTAQQIEPSLSIPARHKDGVAVNRKDTGATLALYMAQLCHFLAGWPGYTLAHFSEPCVPQLENRDANRACFIRLMGR